MRFSCEYNNSLTVVVLTSLHRWSSVAPLAAALKARAWDQHLTLHRAPAQSKRDAKRHRYNGDDHCPKDRRRRGGQRRHVPGRPTRSSAGRASDVPHAMWQAATGRAAMQQASGQSFEERAARHAINQEQEMARKTFPVTDAMRERVRLLAGVGVPQHDIAAIIDCDEKTLRKHFRIELNRGVAEANAVVATYLFAKVKEGNVTAQIFWLKTRAHWREGRAPEDPVPGAEAGSHRYVVILPDNGRDPQVTEQRQKAQDEYFARKRRR